MNILNSRIHGYIDYAIVALLVLAPSLFGFAGLPATICYILAVVQLGMSLLTAYPLGVVKAIPFPIHGGIELGAGLFLIASPWLFNFAHIASAQIFFIIAGVAVALVWMVTNYRTADTEVSTSARYRGDYP
ncbi:SPW repeat domain-containing protein [Chondromyces apiculatus]|uniref:SPW repeat-containing integral membrane domain-containing protein n=1 Tax=Chondromyces apiculatus DSM 436 TaxID=1192034 RepID=A0A017SVD0_9BACT|nr:SPW repeat protein [Chondromyces apiculatus]EYF00929.1 Hypothetical protein CAP_8877 [Chondromyces apiculatus DSM 436]